MPSRDRCSWLARQGTGAQECDLRSAVPGQKQSAGMHVFLMGFWFFCLDFVCVCVCVFCCFLYLFLLSFCLFVWILVLVFFCCWGFSFFFIFESSALIWERETVTERKKFCTLYLGLSGFVYLQSLVK